jgi:NAD(P)-dependent dehydrogenase (short-subunit alcohol dehydrogenase family)
MKDHWTTADMPDQHGRTAVVTGANTGIGYETALALAEKGAHVVLACRSEERGAEALQRIERAHPAGSADRVARTELVLLDLADLDSVRRFAEDFLETHDRLDLLVNNAGVMVPPFGTTEDGFELQIGVNFMGHFALTGLLVERLREAPEARVVTVSSLAHRSGRIDLDRFEGAAYEKGDGPGGASYKPWREYNQSKLADLMFAVELQRRLAAKGHASASLAAHPGFTATDLQHHMGRLLGALVGLWSNDAATGALPTLYAATAPAAEPGGYYGPRGFYEIRGHPAPAKIMPRARDAAMAGRLWEKAEALTGVRFLSDASS